MLEIKALKDETIFQTTLTNGLRVAIHPKPDFHNILVSFQVDFGGSDLNFFVGDEKKRLSSGVAHFLEHLMFQNGNINLPEIFADFGAEINAFTSQSMTAYKFKTINHVYYLLDYFLENFRDFQIADEVMEKERRIIIHELTMSDDSVHFDMHQNLMKMMYSDYSITSDVGGKVSEVRRITKQEIESAFAWFYHPQNCSLVITGNVDKDNMLSYLNNHSYNKKEWPEFKKIKRIVHEEPRRIHNKIKKIYDLPDNMITFAVKIPQDILKTKDRESLHIGFGSIVANAFSLGSHTFDYLEKQKLMNVSFFTKLTLEREFGFFDVFIQTNKVKRYIKTMDRILNQISELPLDSEFFEVNKKNILGNYITMFDSLSRSHEFLCNCVSENVRVDHYLDHILNLKPENLDAFKSLFNKDNIFLLTYSKARKNF